MAQTTRPQITPAEHGETDKTVESMAEAITANVEQAAEATEARTQRLVDATHDLADQAAPMLRLVLDRTGPAMHEMVQAESDLAGFWLDKVQEHTQLTMDTMRRLAAARDWRTAFTIQGEFVRESMTLFQEGLLQHMKLTGTITTSLIAAGGANQREAA